MIRVMFDLLARALMTTGLGVVIVALF